MSKRKKIFGLLLLAITLYFIVQKTMQEVHRSSYDDKYNHTVTYILIDGLSADLFNKALSAGQLPFLQSVMQQSTYVRNGISSFPTMTGYAFYPFITGVDACESGIYGLRWFDKKRQIGQLRNYVGRTNVQMNHDIRSDVKTVFDLADPNEYTCSINTYMNRGVKESIKTGYAHTTAKYEGRLWVSHLKNLPLLGKYIAPDHFQHEQDVTDIAMDQLRFNPKVQWITYPSPDAYNHVNGTTKTYSDLLIFIDQKIASLVAASKSLGQKERAFIIVSDHGISDVHTNIDVCPLLHDKGLQIERGDAAIVYTSQLKTEASTLNNLDGYFVINGNLSAYLYFKDNGKWAGKMTSQQLQNFKTKSGKTLNLPQELCSIDGVELALYLESKDKVIVQSSSGRSSIQRRDNTFSYIVESGSDPLQYAADTHTSALVNTGFISDTLWFQSSINTLYPDGLYRIYQLVTKEKSGDITILSKSGYDFAKDYETIVKNYKGGHGGLRKEIITVPYIAYFPNKTPKTIEAMRSEDMGKMVIEWLK
jgi:Type I phosphodiesterase / nucleotide pyrophosphatase